MGETRRFGPRFAGWKNCGAELNCRLVKRGLSNVRTISMDTKMCGIIIF